MTAKNSDPSDGDSGSGGPAPETLTADLLIVVLSSTTRMRKPESAEMPFIVPDSCTACSAAINPSLEN